MIEVHLIGYTADLRHLVLDLDDGADGRYRLLVDPDLFATVDQLRDERRDAGLPVGDLEEFLSEEELAAIAATDEEEGDGHAADARAEPADTGPGMWGRGDALFGPEDDDLEDDDLEDRDEPEEEPTPDEELDPAEEPGRGPEEGPVRISAQVRLVPPSPFAPERGGTRPDPEQRPAAAPPPAPEPSPAAPAPRPRPAPEREPDPEPEPEPEPAVEPKLSPAQIQSLLRSGRSPRVVAREAGTDVAWIERWLPPIMAERTRILDRAQAKRLERPRLGRSRDALGQAVERNLAAKGVPSEELVWEAARRKDGRWKVTVRFLQRDRVRTATWTYDPSDDELKPASELAHELGFSRAKDTGGEAPAEKKQAKKQTPAKKKAAKKKAAKKQAPAKKQTPAKKKAAAKKQAPAEKKAAAKEQAPAKKAAGKKTSAKKAAGKKAPAKKAGPARRSSSR